MTTATVSASETAIAGGVLGTDVGGRVRGLQSGYRARGSGSRACPTTVPSGGDYLCATFDAGWKLKLWAKGAGPFEHVGQHLYINQAGTTSGSSMSQYLNDLRKVYANYGGEPATKQTHITEFGWSTGSVTPTVQAQNLQTAYQTFRGSSYVGRAYWYRTQDLGVTGDLYGLVQGDGALKASFSAYQTYATY
jgi:hypothetical protein